MRKKKNKMGIARRISGLISGNVGVFFAGDGRYRRLMRNRRGKKERRRGIFAIRERPGTNSMVRLRGTKLLGQYLRD